MLRARISLLLPLLALGACGGGETHAEEPPPADDVGDEEPIEMAMATGTAVRDLMVLPHIGVGPHGQLPAGYAAGRALHDQAAGHYEAGRHREAARLFLDAATHFRAPPEGHGEFDVEMRRLHELTCINAAFGFLSAGLEDEARDHVARLQTTDPDCAGFLARELD